MSAHPFRLSTLIALLIFGLAATAEAQNARFDIASPATTEAVAPAFAGVSFLAAEPAVPVRLRFDDPQAGTQTAQGGTPRAKAFVYSESYKTRAKIHRYASFATLPLFVAEGFIGQSLYSNPTQGKRNAHLAVATGIGALFGINAVTGVWNLIEARKDPNGHTRRTIHGILMLAASAGFLATAATAPESEFNDGGQGGFEGGDAGGGSRSLHRGIALTSIGIATASYLIMLFGK